MVALGNIIIRRPSKKIAQRQKELREKLWPEIPAGMLWNRHHHQGWFTCPRTLPLMMSIMDDLAGQPVGTVYLELWCRAYDEGFATLSKQREIAFHSGCDGQRGDSTWRARIRKLAELNFIILAEGPSGALSYALITNPYLVIRRHHQEKTPGLLARKYNALLDRASEIQADDFDLPDPWAPPPAVDPAATVAVVPPPPGVPAAPVPIPPSPAIAVPPSPIAPPQAAADIKEGKS